MARAPLALTVSLPLALALAAACSSTETATDAGVEAAAPDATPAEAGPQPDATPIDAPADAPPDVPADAPSDAPACTAHPVGRLCVRGVPGGSGDEALAVGGRVTFQVVPKGCFSSSCTRVVEASCAVKSAVGTAIELSARFCLAPVGGTACTPDCSGGGFARCEQAGMAAGTYEVAVDGVKVPFTVPSTVPAGGLCAGSPF